MCEHCGYKPGKSKVLQTITVFEKDIGGVRALGAHFEATDEFRGENLLEFDADSIGETGYRIGMLGDELQNLSFTMELEDVMKQSKEQASLVDLTSLVIGMKESD